MYILNLMELIFKVQTILHSKEFIFIFIGSPFSCNVFSSDFTFENYEYAAINTRTSFLIKPKQNSLFNPNIHVDILTPSSNHLVGKIEEKSTNIYVIRFVPNEIGDHEIRFYSDQEEQVLITKFISQVYDASQIRVSDLPVGVAHRPYKFTSKFYLKTKLVLILFCV
jgi:hypothetical protein